MKSTKRVYLFFSLQALLYWNPVSFYLIYSGTVIYSFKLIHSLFWVVFILIIFVLYLFASNKTGKRAANIFFSFSITAIVFAFVVLVNALVGFFAPVRSFPGFLFEPGSKMRYQTVEFNSLASINNLGLRDHTIDSNKNGKYRVLCVGDSWTFGWGVNVENSWPKKLEQYLKQQGIQNAEVINAGRPGMYTRTYKENLEKMIPVLKPDLVLLGVLQLDDLAQLYEETHRVENKENISFWKKMQYAAKTFLQYSVRNLLAHTTKEQIEINIRETWKGSAWSITDHFSESQQRRYDIINDSVKALFKTADISPSVLYYYINYFDRVTVFNNPGNAATKFALAEMDKDIAGIKALCSANNSALVFLNLPTHIFTGHKQPAMPDDSLDGWFQKNNKVDSLYRNIAFENNVRYFELTNEFRTTADTVDYFFRYDRHPNEKGYEKIAGLTGRYLIDNNIIPKK